ncbi:terminase small subunit [uncultured Lactobacillus sp.]|uniref:terminase small subunit n=1 Tax=uncultured Lactobacillus sp. TaxID=153152 RepID=UPI0026054475|nr:terminase small subunit [uncultured Lactobacillus sp.]
MSGQKLTVKQKRFADEYIKTGNATDAAIKAGYSEKYAHTNANKLLQNTTIKARVDAQMQKLEDDKIMKASEALQGITAIARGEAKAKAYVGDDKATGEPVYREIYPTIKEIQTAYDSILKRYPVSDADKAQIKKAQAEAIKAQAEAQVAKAQAEQLHTVADKTREKMDKLSTEELRNLAKLAGEKDD